MSQEAAGRRPALRRSYFKDFRVISFEQFQQYAAEGRIHYFIPSGRGGTLGTQNGGSDAGAQITAWVQQSFASTTIGGTTVYDLSASASGSSASVAGLLAT